MPTSQRPRWLAYLALGIGVFCVSFSAIFVRWADTPGTVISFYRVAIAALLLTWPFYRRVKERDGGSVTHWGHTGG